MSSSSEVLSIEDVEFQGIALDAKGERIVIINGEMLKVGSELDALTVVSINEGEAVISIRDKLHNLALYEKKGGSTSD